MKRLGRPPHPDILTPREWEVLDLLREGVSNEEIAQRLGITLAGAKYHASEILGKLAVGSREEAARWQPERRPRWATAVAPLGFLWRRVNASSLSTAVAGGLAVVVVAGVGLLVWGLLRTGGGSDAPVGAANPTPVLAGGFIVTPPRPLSPPLVIATPDLSFRALYLLNPETGEVRQLPTTGGTFSPDGKLLATESFDQHGLDVLIVATGERVRIFDQPSSTGTWSPDNSQLAITMIATDYEPDVEEGLFIAQADGSGYRKLADILGLSPYWSPDGEFIAVTVQETVPNVSPNVAPAVDVAVPTSIPTPTRSSLMLLRLDGSEQRTLLEGSFSGLAWSPSGSQVAYRSGERTDPGSPIMVLDVASGSTRPIVDDPRYLSGLYWSPDEQEIAFVTIDRENLVRGYADSGYEVHVVPSDGSAPPQHIANGRGPSWSPDGRYLAFVGNWCQPPDALRFDLMVFDKDTGAVRTVTPPELDIFWAEWSPVDDSITVHTLEAEPGIYTIRPDGSQLRLLHTLSSITDEFGWTPGGSHILFYAPPVGHGVCD